MKYDVVVAGAGPGGFGAALGAARAGGRVLLIDRNSGPGGVAVYCGCPVLSGFFSAVGEGTGGAVGALAEALGKRAADIGGNLHATEFDIGLEMTRLLRDAGVELLFYVTLTGVRKKKNGRIRSLTVSGCGENFELEAENFVDATGDAVAASLAGAETVVGTPEESMTKTVLFRVSGVTSFDKLELIRRFNALDFPFPHQDRFMGVRIGGGNGDVLLNLTAVSGNALDVRDLTRMDIELREQIPVILEWLRTRIPEFRNCRLAAVAPVIGVRGSRNIRGLENISCRDLDENTSVAEPVAIGKRSYGEHYVHCFESPWMGRNAGTRPVPYGALLPLGVPNLAAAGRCIAVEPRAVSAIRLMPVCMATGQAAGIAAALGFPSYETLRMELRRQGCHYERRNV